MPVEQRDTTQTMRAVVLGLGAVAAAIGFLALVLWVTDRGAVDFSLGDDVLDAGRIDVIADEIRENGPISYPDLTGGRQNIFVQHLGDDDRAGWYAFDMVVPGQPPECQLEWISDKFLFRDSCDPMIEISQSGAEQPNYPITIDADDRLIVDFRGDEDEADDSEG